MNSGAGVSSPLAQQLKASRLDKGRAMRITQCSSGVVTVIRRRLANEDDLSVRFV